MNINGKKILIFPEYHLTDFLQQVPLTKEEAYKTLDGYKKFGFDILISSYVEPEVKYTARGHKLNCSIEESKQEKDASPPIQKV